VVLAQDLADRRGHLALGEDAGRDLVEQRLEEVVGGAVDQRHVHIGVPQGLGGEEAAESRADDDDPVPAGGVFPHVTRTSERPAV
jgi:hypothetical protein